MSLTLERKEYLNMQHDSRMPFEVSEKNLNKNNILLGCDSGYTNAVQAPDGKELSLIAYIPIDKLVETSTYFKDKFEKTDYDNKAIYVFSYYDKDEYFLDYITDVDDCINGYTRVLIAEKNQFQLNINKFYSTLSIDSDLESMSFFGGTPKFLQEENFDFLNEYIFIGQILGMDLPETIEDLFYLTGNIGYIFIKNDMTEGVFFVQST